MTLWSVSVSDFYNSRWNTGIGLGVFLGGLATAGIVTGIAKKALSSDKINEQQYKYAQYGSALLGLAVVGAAYLYLPGSSFALITDDSTSKMLKLAVLQTVVGLALDRFVFKNYPFAGVGNLCGALSTRIGFLPLAVYGIIGTAIGSQFI